MFCYFQSQSYSEKYPISRRLLNYLDYYLQNCFRKISCLLILEKTNDVKSLIILMVIIFCQIFVMDFVLIYYSIIICYLLLTLYFVLFYFLFSFVRLFKVNWIIKFCWLLLTFFLVSYFITSPTLLLIFLQQPQLPICWITSRLFRNESCETNYLLTTNYQFFSTNFKNTITSFFFSELLLLLTTNLQYFW